MSSQLGRTLLSRGHLSADQQEAVPDERGSYGELMDAIDRVLGPGSDEEDSDPSGGQPPEGLAFPRE